ncbi:sugar phosphate isomerase/epimerase family protein [Sphingomonas sp.]|uniref:sugar phosphate isomerase/epimerase family protein n=1 Tax=Sphingomonas sp. TaxID=28214 RepID=UPI002DD6325B|nr:TIM barrel protein [Sphingomonas sp.]
MRNDRRQFLIALPLAAIAGGCAMRSTGTGSAGTPRFGIQTYSFRDMLPADGDMVDKMIAGCRAIGVSMVELFEPTIQPPALSADAPWAVKGGKPTEASLYGRPPEGPRPADVLANRERIRQWRLETPLSRFEAIGRRFADAGIEVQAFNFGLKDDCTDAEVDRGFAMTRAMGARIMTASTTLTMAKRTVPFVARHRVLLGLHGHSNLRDPNELATPESFEAGLAMSPWYRINFDIGHFSAAGFDTLAFLEKHHARTVSVHIKDREDNNGMNRPLGEGGTPVREVVARIATRGWDIPILLEYEYAGGPSIDELRRMLAYCQSAARG